MISPIVPKELNFEKFYKGVWENNFKLSANRKADELRSAIHDVGMSAPGFFNNLLKNIANPYYYKEYEYHSDGSFKFEIPFDDYGNSLRELFNNHFGHFDVCSFPLTNAPSIQESTFISTIVYVNGRPLTDEKFIVLRQYSIDIVIIPWNYLRNGDNIAIEQRRFWNKPSVHYVAKMLISDEYSYIFNGMNLGCYYSSDNGFVQKTGTTFCPSASRGDKFLNKGDYLLYFKANEKSKTHLNLIEEYRVNNEEATTGKSDEEVWDMLVVEDPLAPYKCNFNSSTEWKLVPKDLYSITKIFAPSPDYTHGENTLKLTFNVEGKKQFSYKEYNELFGNEKKYTSEIKFFSGLYPTIDTFIEQNDFIIMNNSAQWEINIGPKEKPDPLSHSAIGNEVTLEVEREAVDNLMAYYPFIDTCNDYSGNACNPEEENIVNITFEESRTLNGEYLTIPAIRFNGKNSSIMILNDRFISDANRNDGLTCTVWMNQFDYFRDEADNSYYTLIMSKTPAPSEEIVSDEKEYGFYFKFDNKTQKAYAYLDKDCVVEIGKKDLPTLNEWQHYAITAEKNDKENVTVIIYKNGEVIGRTDTGTPYPTGLKSFPLFIGFDPCQGANRRYNGLMRHFRIFNKALNQETIHTIMISDGYALQDADLSGRIKVPICNHFNYIPLEAPKKLIEKQADEDKETNDKQYLDTREFRDIRPFSEEQKLLPSDEKLPLPVALPEELIVLVNENKEEAEVLESYEKAQADQKEKIAKYIANYKKAKVTVDEIKEEMIDEVYRDREEEGKPSYFLQFKNGLDSDINQLISDIKADFIKDLKVALAKDVNEAWQYAKAIADKFIDRLSEKGYGYDAINDLPSIYESKLEEIIHKVQLYYVSEPYKDQIEFTNEYSETISFDIEFNEKALTYTINDYKINLLTTSLYYKNYVYNRFMFLADMGYTINDQTLEIALSGTKVTQLYRDNGVNGNEMVYLQAHGYKYVEATDEFVVDPDYEDKRPVTYYDKDNFFKLVPYIDYTLEEVDGHPVGLRFFKHLPNSASVRIIKIEPKNWFFFDAFFSTLNTDGIVILDKQSDFPVNKAYLDCTINNQNVEKSLITNISDKAIHINAFDATNLAYFRFAVPKCADTYDFMDKYETFKTDLEKYFDAVGLYNDPTDVDETYEINTLNGVEFRVHPSISPSLYDFPSRINIYQEDMNYGNVKAPAYRVVRYCTDETCKYNNAQDVNYIGRHLEHDDTWLYNASQDKPDIEEYSKFFRLKDNTHRVPACEFRILFNDRMLEYNELYGTLMQTTEPDGTYLSVKENHSETGFDIRGRLLYINSKGEFVFAKDNLDEDDLHPRKYIDEETDFDIILEESEKVYEIESSDRTKDRVGVTVTDPPLPEMEGVTPKKFMINGGYEPITLYDYARESRIFQSYISDDCSRENSSSILGITYRPFNWTIVGSVATSNEATKYSDYSLCFFGDYKEDNKTVESYVKAHLNDLVLDKSVFYENGGSYTQFTKENDGLFEISFWAKPDKNSKGKVQGLVCDNNNNFILYLDENGDFRVRCEVRDENEISTLVELKVDLYGNLYNDQWHHFMFQIKDFGNHGRKAIIGVDGITTSHCTIETSDSSINYVNMYGSDYLCIGKGFEFTSSESSLVKIKGNSFRGFIEGFFISKVIHESGGDILNTQLVMNEGIAVINYDRPDFNLVEKFNKIEERTRFFSLLTLLDGIWTDKEKLVVYDPNKQSKANNYGEIRSRQIRVINNEIYEEGKHPLEVPALYFKNVNSEII